jgi:signal transduction histidine kinase
VIGSNYDGVWNREGVSLQLIILPPFWQTWWFITFTILLLGGIVYYLSTVRIRNLLSIEKLKTKIAADLHDNIGSGLTEISILSELASNEVKAAAKGSEKRLRNISDLSRQLVDNMSDIVWVVNPKRDSLYDLILRLKDSYSDIFTSLGISFRTNNLEKLSEVKLPMDYRQNLFMIFKEGISNAVKHSKCNKISLDVNVNKEIIELILKDDGVGIDLDEGKAGNGLKNMELRAKAIKGKLEWNSNPGKGTTIHFKGKVKNNPPLLSYFKK